MAEGDGDAGGRPAAGGGGAGGNVFTRKIGPAPVWVWMLAALGLALAFASWRKNKSGASTAATTSNAASAGMAASSSQTPPFIIQNYPTQGSGPPSGHPATPVPQGSQSLPPATNYTITGKSNPSDQYPGGVAISAYKLQPSDSVDVSYYATLITLLNPGLSAPFPVGSTIKVPINTNTTTHTSPFPATT